MAPPVTRARWIAPALWAILIETLTSWPNPPSVSIFSGGDKVVHMGLYAMFAFLVVRAAQPGIPGRRTMAIVLVAMCAWAALDEWHQIFVAGRSADLTDWAADASGAVIGLVVRRLETSVA